MRVISIVSILFLILLSFSMCDEGSESCGGSPPADHTIAVEDGACLHKTGMNAPVASGCYASGCHRTYEAFASGGTAPSCLTCHQQFWID